MGSLLGASSGISGKTLGRLWEGSGGGKAWEASGEAWGGSGGKFWGGCGKTLGGLGRLRGDSVESLGRLWWGDSADASEQPLGASGEPLGGSGKSQGEAL